MTRNGLSFLPVTFGHPTCIYGRRCLHQLHDVADDVADACLALYLSMYARDIFYLCMQQTYIYLCVRETYSTFVCERDIYIHSHC